jgi:hypothetical protein
MAKRRLSIMQLVLLGCLVVALVFGVTYVSITLGSSPKDKQGPGPILRADPVLLKFTQTRYPPSEINDPDPVLAREWHIPGHHHFWFENPTAEPVQVTLIAKDCRCTGVAVAVLPEELKDVPKADLDQRADSAKLDWHVLDPNDTRGFRVPANAAGAIRLSWKGDKEGKSRPRADLRTESGATAANPIQLEVSLNLLPPLLVGPEEGLKEAASDAEVQVGTLRAGDVRTLNLICWSETRANAKVKADKPTDACIQCGTPQPLSTAECEALSKSTGKKMLCAYHIPVTVRERTEDGGQFDLGRFRRHLTFSSDTPGVEPAHIALGGFVRGDVTVGSLEDKDMVMLGSWEHSEGITKSIPVMTADPSLNMTVEGIAVGDQIDKTSDLLKVDLQPVDQEKGQLGKVWTLTVEVPKNTLSGAIPPHTAIILKTEGARPRKVRIPVIGIAYVK